MRDSREGKTDVGEKRRRRERFNKERRKQSAKTMSK
jgi:hypothetical protein